MILTYILDQPCPKCNKYGKYGNVNVSLDTLMRGCNYCGYRLEIPLPSLKKKILYLDQFFLSHAFRNKEKLFIEAVKRIEHLAAQQLIVCPYSSTHTEETHLWRHDEQSRLFKFIKQTARGHKFSELYYIKDNQLSNSFESYLKTNQNYYSIQKRDAFRENVHLWDDYFWIDIRPFIADIETIRENKKNAITALVGLFESWRKNKADFEQDRRTEALGFAEALYNRYITENFKLLNDEKYNFLDMNIETQFIDSLLHFDKKTLPVEQRLERIKSFLVSDYFVNTPYLDISCQLFSVLRKKVRMGRFQNKNKAEDKLAGFFYDVEFISVLGPYCDAMFIDREMRNWLLDSEANICERYSFAAYSVENWEEFHKYLDLIEQEKNQELTFFLNLVYPKVDDLG